MTFALFHTIKDGLNIFLEFRIRNKSQKLPEVQR